MGDKEPMIGDEMFQIGEKWNVVVFQVEWEKLVEILKECEVITVGNLTHYTIRDTVKGSRKVVVSWRIHRTYTEDRFDDQIKQRFMLMFKRYNVKWRWNPTTGKWGEWNAWMVGNSQDKRRTIQNCSILSQLSSIAINSLSSLPSSEEDPDHLLVEYAHLFCNMLGLKETIYMKYAKPLGREILGPGYEYQVTPKGLQEFTPIYYHKPGYYEAMGLEWVSVQMSDLIQALLVKYEKKPLKKPKKKQKK